MPHKRKRRFYSSGVQIGYGVGLMLAAGSVSLVMALLGEEAFIEWGWRLPFILSSILVMIAMWLRKEQVESIEFTEVMQKNAHKTQNFSNCTSSKRKSKRLFLYHCVAVGGVVVNVFGNDFCVKLFNRTFAHGF